MLSLKMTCSLATCALALLTAFVLGGCAEDRPVAAGGAATKPAVVESAAASTSGAQLWSDNCARCHNLRSPETYSSAQWELAVHHMRLRANLTGEEARKVTEFLKSAN